MADDQPTPEPEPNQDAGGEESPKVFTRPEDEAGLKALDSERKARAAAERQAKALEQQLAELQQQQMTDTERAIAEAKAEGAREAQSKIAERIVRAEIRLAAAGTVAPEAIADLPALMGELAKFVRDDGEVDTDGITAVIAELVESRPYLAPRVADVKPAPDPDQGASGSGGAQLTADQLKNMSPEEAFAAFTEGRASAAIGSR